MPPAPAAPAKPSPAPAPSPSPTPAPTPAPAATPTPSPATSSTTEPDPFSEFEAAMARVDPRVDPKPDKPATPDRPTTPEPSKEPPKPQKKEDKPSGGPPQLRAELERVKGELEAKNTAYSEMEAKIRDYEAKGKDTTLLTERLNALEKTIADKDAELRMLKQEASPEFKAKYDKPFDDAADFARSTVEQLVIETVDPATQTVTESKPATWDDFVEIYRLPLSKALSAAKAKFGDASQVVIGHITELKRLDRVRDQALKEERANAEKRMKEEESKTVAQREQVNLARQAVRKDLAERDPFYRDPPEDKESSDLRAKAYSIYDREEPTIQGKIVKEEAVRHMVAAHPVLKRRIAKLEAELAKFKEQKKDSEEVPGKTQRGGGAETSPQLSWEEEARSLDLK